MHDASTPTAPTGTPLFDEPTGTPLFDEPTTWRAEAAQALGIEGDELLAAVSPGAACPMVLRSLLASISTVDPLATIVDIGSGSGGISEWFRLRTDARVIAVEPAAGARATAASLFPELIVRSGTADRTGLADDTGDVVVLCGVLSLIDQPEPVFEEIERLLRPGGVLAIADLFSSDRHSFTSRPNVFRSIEQVNTALSARGWSIIDLGCGTPRPDPTWAEAGELVDDWIRTRRAEHPAFAIWAADQEHLSHHIVGGDLVAGSIVAGRPPACR